MNIYTKNGDRGTTDLVRTKNVSKSDDRIQLVGTIEELISHLGLVRTMMKDQDMIHFLEKIQGTLTAAMAGVADPYNREYKLGDERTELLEQEMERIWKKDGVPVLVDPAGLSIEALRPAVVVDAILAKKNLGTTKEMAPLVIALGPGFTAGEDVDVVIETKRGHNLGRVIRSGSAVPNTGIPGIIGGYGKERVMHAQAEGILRNAASIGDIVEARAVIAEIETENGTVPVEASLSGLLRGLIRDGYPVTKGFKIADIDPRKEELQNCFTISDKARCIAGSVLEAICGELE